VTSVLSDGEETVYPSGVELFAQGQILEEVFFIVSGTVKLTQIDGQGRESLVGFATSLVWPGSAAVIANQPAPTSAITCSKTVLHRHPVETFRKLLCEDKELSTVIHEAHAEELCRQSKWIGQLCSNDASGRLRTVLWQFALNATQAKKRPTIRIQLPIRQWELAEFIGVTPEHLSRLLKELERKHLISRDKGWVVILDLRRLAESGDGRGL